jgi:hypothetical protein
MSEVRFTRRSNPSLTVSSTDPHRIVGAPHQTTPSTRPRVRQFDAQQSGVRIGSGPVMHDMRRAGPASNGAAIRQPSPLVAAEVRQASPSLTKTSADVERELAALRAENEALREAIRARRDEQGPAKGAAREGQSAQSTQRTPPAVTGSTGSTDTLLELGPLPGDRK